MRTYAQLLNSASNVQPFSNSTEGSAWTATWCDECACDRGAPDDGCPILLIGLMGKTPAEWLPQDRMRLGYTYRCTAFRKDRKPTKSEQQIAGQLALFGEGSPDDLGTTPDPAEHL